MMLIVAFEVVMRHVFSRPTIGALEVNQTLLCIYSALAGGYTLLHQGHVNVEIVYQYFGTKTRLVIDILTYFLFFGFIIILLWQTWDMAVDSDMIKERSESLFGLPLYPAKISIVVGAFLIFLQGIANFLRKVIALITGVESPRPPNIFGKSQK